MPNCFQLIRNGEAVPLVKIDEEMCLHFEEPCDAKRWFREWYDCIGHDLAMGHSFEEIKETYAVPAFAEFGLLPVAEWLEANFTVLVRAGWRHDCGWTLGADPVTTSEARPLVGISVLVEKDGKLLLGKRKGSHGAGEYAAPGGHLEHLESFQSCAAREVLEETGLVIGPLLFLRVLNSTQYAPKHYVDLAFVAQWQSGDPEVREPDKVESWDWYDVNDIPSPLFAMLPSAIAMWIDARPLQLCQDLP